jgi:hypothetical protein
MITMKRVGAALSVSVAMMLVACAGEVSLGEGVQQDALGRDGQAPRRDGTCRVGLIACNGVCRASCAPGGASGAAGSGSTPNTPTTTAPPVPPSVVPPPIPPAGTWNQPPGSVRCQYNSGATRGAKAALASFVKSENRVWCLPSGDVNLEWRITGVASTGVALDNSDRSVLSLAGADFDDYTVNDPTPVGGTGGKIQKFKTCTVSATSPVIAPSPSALTDVYVSCTWRSPKGYDDKHFGVPNLYAGFPDASGVIAKPVAILSNLYIEWDVANPR